MTLSAATTQSAGRTLRPIVLLVEDEPTIAVTLRDDLADSGYEVVQTGDGGDAIAILASRRFDAVITDLRLPGADGVQVVRAARAARPDVPVLVISAWLDGHRERIRALGAAALGKPFCNRAILAWLGSPNDATGVA
ncbi:MAG: response regulator [Planctomycetes bacterium]|nr:response regulator [Planctomycetota bacterium]